jgi:hypothetical protein
MDIASFTNTITSNSPMYHQPEHSEVGQQVGAACAWVPPPLLQCQPLQDYPPLYTYKTREGNMSHKKLVPEKSRWVQETT